MKIYIASKYQNKNRVTEIAQQLEAAGFAVVSTWHKEDYSPNTSIHDVLPSDLRQMAHRDVREIKSCCLILVLTEGCEQTRGGLHWETGCAFAMDKFIAILGPKTILFHFLAGVEHYATLEKFIALNKKFIHSKV